MRRYLFAVGLLASAAAAQSEAGYVIVRIVLDGAGGAEAGGTSGGPMGSPTIGPTGSGTTPPGAAAADPSRSVLVVVPFNKKWERRRFYEQKTLDQYWNPVWEPVLTHPQGWTNLFLDGASVQWYTEFAQTPGYAKTRASAVKEKHDEWARKPADGQPLLDLIGEALEHGMVAEAVAYADELLDAVQKKTTRAGAPVEAFAAAYDKVRAALKKPATGPADSARWKNTLSQLNSTPPGDQTQGHYCLISWDATTEERGRRLAQLNANFKAFFLLHATRGVALPVPERPLLVVLTQTGGEVRTLLGAVDGMPPVADGFYAPDHDLLVLAPERTDDVGITFARQLQQMYGLGISRTMLLESSHHGPFTEIHSRLDLLKGATDPKNPSPMSSPTPVPVKVDPKKKPDPRRPDDVARMMTWALVERYAQDEAEWAAVSLEGSRQLMYATGQIPRHVAVPQWLSAGAGAYFHRPRGPLYTTKPDGEKAVATLGLTTGYGRPNYLRQRQFKELVDRKQLSTDPGVLLRNVVTDAYFAAVREQTDADDPSLPPPPPKKKTPPATGTTTPMSVPTPMTGFPGTPGTGAAAADDATLLARRKREFLAGKAQATAWSLYYYLAKNDPAGLDRYLAALNRLPRDLPLDDATRLTTFAKALNLTTEAKKTDDRPTFAEFAAGWLRATANLPPAGVDIDISEPAPPPKTNPDGTPAAGP